MLIFEIVGWAGTALLVTAYATVSLSGRKPSLHYQVLNGSGAIGLIVNGAVHGAWPSVGLNVVWLGIGVVAIMTELRARVSRGDDNESH